MLPSEALGTKNRVEVHIPTILTIIPRQADHILLCFLFRWSMRSILTPCFLTFLHFPSVASIKLQLQPYWWYTFELEWWSICLGIKNFIKNKVSKYGNICDLCVIQQDCIE